MTRIKQILAGLTMLALVTPASSTALAVSDHKAMQPPEDCKVHEPVTADCHVHDKRTYQHMRMQDRDGMSSHAQREMRDHQRKQWQMMRN